MEAIILRIKELLKNYLRMVFKILLHEFRTPMKPMDALTQPNI